MSRDADTSLKKTELGFFGKITTGATHEINNVFSIIKENIGLLSDWSEKAKGEKGIEPEKLARVSEGVRKQLGRGQDIVKQLNKFAHSVDEPAAEVELGEVLENMAYLSHRYVRRKALKLEINSPKKGVWVKTDPFVLRLAVFSIVGLYLKTSGEGSTVSLGAGEENSVPFIEFSGGELPADKDMEEEIKLLKSLVEELKGEVEINSPGNEIRLKIGGS